MKPFSGKVMFSIPRAFGKTFTSQLSPFSKLLREPSHWCRSTSTRDDHTCSNTWLYTSRGPCTTHHFGTLKVRLKRMTLCHLVVFWGGGDKNPYESVVDGVCWVDWLVCWVDWWVGWVDWLVGLFLLVYGNCLIFWTCFFGLLGCFWSSPL